MLDEIQKIQDRIGKLEVVLSIAEKKRFIQEEELKTQSANFWDDPKSAEQQLKKSANKKYGSMPLTISNPVSMI